MTSLIRPRRIPIAQRAVSPSSLQIMHDLDAILHAPDQRTKMSYRSLRSMLNKVPRPERGVEWTERVVKLYCCKLMRAQRCNALRNRLGAIRLREGQTDHHTAFCDELTQITAPYILTLHGYTLPFRNRDQTEVVTELSAVCALLSAQKIEYFINSGTLLGAVREGTFLGHDDDADLAVVVSGDTEQERMRSFIEIGHQLKQAQELRKPIEYSKATPVMKIELKSGVKVDLFPLWIEDDRVFVWPHTFGELATDDVFPLSMQRLNEVSFPAPKDPPKMLQINYGEGWNSPDAHFQFPWSQAKQKFKSTLDCYHEQRPKKFPDWVPFLGG